MAYGAEAAKELERQLSAEHSGKAPAPNKALTVYKLYNSYINVKKNEIRETSLNRVEKILSNHVLPTLKDIKAQQAEHRDIAGLEKPHRAKRALHSHQKNIYGYFSAMLNFCRKNGIPELKPADQGRQF